MRPPLVAWHELTPAEALNRLESRPEGLPPEVAERRRRLAGPNRLVLKPPTPAWRIFASQFRSVVTGLLVAAAIVAWATADPIDAAAIGAVLILNATIGFVIELRARRAIESLSTLTPRRALVVRPPDGRAVDIDAALLVPGDVVVVEAGQSVPADLRVLTEHGLRVDEATLTGESVPVGKHPDALTTDTPLPDRRNLLFAGTVVVDGRGRAVVVGTGANTELGRIGQLLSSLPDGRTPLERRLDELGRRLVWLTVTIAAVVGLLGWWHGLAWSTLISTSLALAVAAVPEGLPTVATIALAVGVRRMARRRALVRRLPSVETLGSVTVIGTDKTGTLTAGEMVVTRLWIAGTHYTIAGDGYGPVGRITPALPDWARVAAQVGVLASRGDAIEREGRWVAVGDPTDAAFVALGRRVGLERRALLAASPEAGEVPFSSHLRLMATFHRRAESAESLFVAVKGAPQAILDRCTHRLGADGSVSPLTPEDRAAVEAVNAEYAAAGLRVIGLARGSVAGGHPTHLDASALQALTWIGLAGLIDPPAEGVKPTIAAFRNAGIRTVMITGDQALTAAAIGRDLGLLDATGEVVHGGAIDDWSDQQVREAVGRVAAYSRVTPEAKLRIVAALQAAGEVVAVIGDGVNDAAALRKADVGVAMGGRGTDVAREAADVVLQDDAFPTIGAAIEEGRLIFDNIRKFVFYLFSCNLAEIGVLLGAGLVGAMPLLPIQILWLNLVTDTFPALALAVEPAESNAMARPPRDPGATILSRRFVLAITWHAVLLATATLVAWGWAMHAGPALASTVAFMTLALAQLFHLGTARSHDAVVTPARAVANPWALAAVALVVALQILSVSWQPLQAVLDTTPLTPAAWLVTLAAAATPGTIGQAIRLRRASRHSSGRA